MKTFVIKLMRQLTCILKGHEPKTMLIENDIGIFNTGCSRCGCHIGLAIYWKFMSKCYPPNCITSEQRKAFDEFEESYMQEKRNLVKIQIIKDQEFAKIKQHFRLLKQTTKQN